MAAVYPGDGRWRDGSRMDAQRGVVLPRAAVAPGTDGLKTGYRLRSGGVERLGALRYMPGGVNGVLKTNVTS